MNSYYEAALEKVTECIMDFGAYPQPRKVGLFLTSGSTKPKQFDLTDFIIDKIDPVELAEYFAISMNDHSTCGAFSDLRSRWTKKVQSWLEADAKVIGLAHELADKNRADEEETRDEETNDPRRGQAAEINRSRL